MAVMCYTSVIVDGNKDLLKKLVELLESLDDEASFESVLDKRGIDTTGRTDLAGWIEEFEAYLEDKIPTVEIRLASKYGIDEDLIEEMFCFDKEFDDDFEDEDYDEFDYENLMHFYYRYEVEGGPFGTNDSIKKYFPERYFVYDPDPDTCEDYHYYETEEEVINHLRRHLPELTVEDLEYEDDVNEQLRDKLGEDAEIAYHIYKVID